MDGREAPNPAAPADGSVVRLGDFVLDGGRFELRRGTRRLRLQPKTFEVLRFLVANPGRIVRDELVRAVWPGVIVTENSLARCIKDLRKALGDDALHPRYIETVARRGYRLLVSPEPVEAGELAGGLRRWPPRFAVFASSFIASVLIAGAAWIIAAQRPEAAAPAPASIAVLPFTGSANDADAQQLAEALAEDLIERLAQVPSLRVIARASSFAYRGVDKDLRLVGRDLGVDWLLEGRVRSETGAPRLEIALVDARTGHQAWSGRYERARSDHFAMKEEIAGTIVERISPSPPQPRIVAGWQPTASFEAYQQFTIGRDYLSRRPSGWRKLAGTAFERAIELDPHYAAPHAGKAIVETLLARDQPAPAPAFALAAAAADRSLSLDPRLALGHAARGLLLLEAESDFRAAEAPLRRAIALDPALSVAYNWLYIALQRMKRKDDALAVLEAGLRVDPLNPVLLENRGAFFEMQARFEDARAAYERMLALPQRSTGPYIRLVALMTAHGHLADALRHARAMEREWPDMPFASLVAASTYARLGMQDEAAQRLARLPAPAVNAPVVLRLEDILRRSGRESELRALARLESPAPWLRRYQGRRAMWAGDHREAVERLGPLFDRDTAAVAWDSDRELIDSRLAYVHSLQRTNNAAEAQSQAAALLAAHARAKREGFGFTPDDLYLMAMTLALADRDAEALDFLDRALKAGWRDAAMAASDPRWGRLRGEPRFRSAIEGAAAAVSAERAKVLAQRL